MSIVFIPEIIFIGFEVCETIDSYTNLDPRILIKPILSGHRQPLLLPRKLFLFWSSVKQILQLHAIFYQVFFHRKKYPSLTLIWEELFCST